ncbi:hypothetical protein SAMN05444287_1071 [Octadecabacter temperatus]|uniref:DUF6456 domain-containing protein n=1 Tax=Octadecabacter temperatus TaxID=1458307 RepID=A0A0K0Y510_9RHOB|nr:DUF6456 domain-containing protein [Octadecabacter temperatus]AKS45966.1 hypothetical protein OSB_14140 [Octadecabacter temperatus]SIO04590.1 hypothetical protein SAMN05444287_1071 [Octadecabacter temperatus]
MTEAKTAVRAVPSWVPNEVRNYVFHTEMGQPIRVLARSQSCHASTIMRQIRKVETRRDDPLVDRAIKALAEENSSKPVPNGLEMMQALRNLAKPNAMLAIALGMDQGVIIHDTAKGDPDHGSKLPSETAMTLALRGWIEGGQTIGRVLRYRITPAGRVALRELTAETENRARAMAEAPASFEGAPTGTGTWLGDRDDKPGMVRQPSLESPVQALARRKDRDGQPFLNRVMVRAAERLREDYELALVSQNREKRTTLDWRDILHSIETYQPVDTKGDNAVGQMQAALVYLGPGLSEVALRCCCLLEGLETTEKHLGWAARSCKIVLRIALQRLVLHYEARGELGPRIG